MEMRGARVLAASRDVIWVALNDPEVLRLCIPGCESIERISDVEYLVAVAAEVGSEAAHFLASVRLGDVDPPNGLLLAAEAHSPTAGSVSGSARVALIAEEGGTLLAYEIDATAEGSLARLGDAALAARAARLADAFFARFEAAIARLDDTMSPSVEPAAVAARRSAAHKAGPPERRSGLPPAAWVPALMLAVAMMLWLVA